MKKLTLLSAFLGIFAGFLFGSVDIVVAQGNLSNGASQHSCLRKNVKLEIDNTTKDKIWKECDKGSPGCNLRFCNDKPFKSEGDKAFWEYGDCNKYCVGFQEELPIGKDKIKSISANSGTDLVMNYVSMIYKFGAAVLGMIAVLVIVVSGVQLMFGGVDDGSISSAKDRILQAILSLVLLFSSALILKTINPGFFT